MKLDNYCPPQQSLWQGRHTLLPQEYFYQLVELIDIQKCSNNVPFNEGKKALALIGFCCDAGVQRNQGRVGAKQGPEIIRQQLANLAWHFSNVKLYDFGDIVCDNDELEAAQQSLATLVTFTLDNNILPIVLGGGHETAWGHFQGIRSSYPNKNLHIINFDAHFDLRESINNKASSGTPFLQIAEHSLNNNLEFNYLVLGIQEAANTDSLFATAKKLAVHYLTADHLFQISLAQQQKFILEFLNNTAGVYLTFCLDVMSAAIAPGVSAPQINGLMPQQIWPLLNFIINQNKLIAFDIVELAPNYDKDFHTAKLASRIIYEMINAYSAGK